MLLFDRSLLKRRRARASATLHAHDFLFQEMALRLADRISDIPRSFPTALDLGCHSGYAADALKEQNDITTLIKADLSVAFLKPVSGIRIACDEEALPFGERVFDVVVSAGSLHWVNDLPGSLVQIKHILKPEGLFMAVFPGGETLKELREAILQAEIAEEGGSSPRISPFVDVRDGGALLSRAGFESPVADSETLTVIYKDAFALMRDLRGMGEANALISRPRRPMRRATLTAIAEIYQSRFADAQGRIPATFELITLTGWRS